MTDWLKLAPLINVGINAGLLVTAIALTRKFSRLELKVELMWDVFQKKIGIDSEEE